MFIRSIKEKIETILNKQCIPIQMNITNKCNLKCQHCYNANHYERNSLRISEWYSIIDQYFDLISQKRAEPFVILSGGEPTLSPLLYPIIQYIYSKSSDCYVAILTNGTCIENLEMNKLDPKRILFQISLDGPDAKRHDFVRGIGSFEKSTSSIKKLKQLRYEVHISTILSARTTDWIEDFFKMAKELGADWQKFARLVPEGFGKQLVDSEADRPLKPLELKSALENILKYSKKYQIKTNTDCPLYCLVDKKLGINSSIKDAIIIDCDGNLKYSARINYKLGNVLDDSLQTLLMNHPILKKLRSGDVEVCGNCSYYSRCGGDRNASYVSKGHFFARDPGCWL